jgi:putative membrane protein
MRKIFDVALILGAALLALAACQPAEQAGTTGQSAGQVQATPAQSTTDATFINTAGTLGLEEVRFAQLAETKAADPAVRRFAAKMTADHTMVDQRLAALAQSEGITPPSNMDGRHETLYRQLQSLDGPAFDRAYMAGQMQDVTMVIQAFQTEADSGKDPQVRSFAQQYLPMMQQHLQMALTVPAAGP